MRPRSSASVGLVGGVLGLIVLASGSPARADDLVRVKLAYSATDPTCPDPRGFRDLVTSRMGYDPFKDDASGVVTVTIEPAKTKGTLVGSVAMKTRRELLGREGECPELAQALAVALAIVLDPFGEQAAKAKAAPLPEPPPVVPARAPDDAPPARDQPPAPQKPAALAVSHAEIGASAMTTAGLLPFPALGAGARFALGQGMFSGGAGARFLTTSGDVTVGSDRVSGSLFTGVLDGCATFSVLSGCLVASAGSFSARSETVSVPTTRHAFFFDLGARVGARVPLWPWLSLEGFIEGRIPFTQTELYVDGRTVFRSTAVTGTLGVGPVFQIW